jgi:hypothetical protein
MPKAQTPIVLDPQEIEQRIFIVRSQRVMLDSDLAKLYGVPTKALNQAVKRHSDRFPEDFAFQLTPQEFTALKSQIVTSKTDPRGGKQKLPWVFTEHGVAMLSSVLNSPQAVQVNIAIMRVFVHVRRISTTPGELVNQLIELARTVQIHDGQIKQIVEVLTQIMEPPPAPPKRKIGFHQSEAHLKTSSNGQLNSGARA